MLPARLSQAGENCNIYLFTLTPRLEIIIYILQYKQSEYAYWNLKLSVGFLRSALVIRNNFTLLDADDGLKQSNACWLQRWPGKRNSEMFCLKCSLGSLLHIKTKLTLRILMVC